MRAQMWIVRRSTCLQFGLMGSVYMAQVMNKPNPRVGLVNIGAEAEKGDRLTHEAYPLMQAQTSYNFTGNVEARDLLLGECDVAVTDGFVGNVILKHTEGLAKTLFSMIKTELYDTTLRAKIGALLVKPTLKNVGRRMDYNAVGGAPLLGVERRGGEGARQLRRVQAIENALAQARRMLEGDMVGKIRPKGFQGSNRNNNQRYLGGKKK